MTRAFFNSVSVGSQQAERAVCACCADRGYTGQMTVGFGGEWDWCADRCQAARKLHAEAKAALAANCAA